MKDKLTSLLKRALLDLESFQEYYQWQSRIIVKYVRNNMGKYKDSIALNKHFYNLANESKPIKLTQEEQAILDKVLDSCVLEKIDEGTRIKYKLKNIDDESRNKIASAMDGKEFQKLADRPVIMNESALIMLLIKYEECISGIFRFLIEKYPSAYLSNKNISYNEIICSNSSLKEIMNRFIDKEVDEIMRGPISDWYKIIADKHNVTYAFDERIFSEFKKIYYKRNIIVHNQGIVNDNYLKYVQDGEYKLGEKIAIKPYDIHIAIDITKIILVGTFIGLKKLFDDKNEFYEFLFNYGYDCLVEKNWRVAQFVNEKLTEDTDQSDATILCERVNCWIAEKNIKGLDSIKAEVEALDVSAMSREFVIAKHALLDEYEDVSKELEKAINKEIPALQVNEWPLFNEYRDSSSYKRFIETHKEEFAELGFDPDDETDKAIIQASIEIEQEKTDLIMKLRESTSFQMTHILVSNLSDYNDWTEEEVEQLCEAAFINTQIRWILDDEDIYKFYSMIVKAIDSSRVGDMTKELKEYLGKETSITRAANAYMKSIEKTKNESFLF